MVDRDDLIPQYRIDLAPRREAIIKVIRALDRYAEVIPELKGLTQEEYKLVFLAAISSLKGRLIAQAEKLRQTWVENIFLKPAAAESLLTYRDTSAKDKCDFQGELQGGIKFGLEVKGGEGNSVTLIDRPSDADFFAIWPILDVMSNTPAENMTAVLGRVVKQMVNKDEKKHKVDFLVFFDEYYLSGMKTFKTGRALPDVIIFPEETPSISTPHPVQPDPSTSVFLQQLYHVIGNIDNLNHPDVKPHIWRCDISLHQGPKGWYREMRVSNWAHPHVLMSMGKGTRAAVKPLDKGINRLISGKY